MLLAGLAPEAVVSQNDLNQIGFRVRQKSSRLGEDVILLEAYEPPLAAERRQTVIESFRGS